MASHDGAERRPGKRPAARGTAFYPRKRANAACQVCRARKTKCDNGKPACSYCVSVGATCIQSPVDLSSFDPASLKILERLDDLERLMKSQNGSASSPQSVHHEQTAQPSPASNLSQEQDHVRLRSVLPETLDSLLTLSVFSPYAPDELPLHDFKANIYPHSATNTTLGRLLDMDSQTINKLLDNFIIYVHCKNPIFDEVSIRRRVTSVIIEGLDWSPNSCLALIICALGRLSTPFGSSPETQPDSAAYLESQCFFQAAQRRIGSLLCQDDVLGAQCLFLSGVYLMCIYQPFHAWRFFSQALAACQTLPFLKRAYNIRPVPAPTPSLMHFDSDETQEQAIYWSSWKSEREVRQELTLPDFEVSHPTQSLYPPFFPTPPQLQESSNNTSDSERRRTSWLFYLAEISLRRLSSRICHEILEFKSRSESDAAFLNDLVMQIPEYERQVQQWSDNLPPELSPHAIPGEDGVCLFVIQGHLVNIYEILYWPFVMLYFSTRQSGVIPISLRARELAEKGLAIHVRRLHVNEPGFFYRHHGTWFMLRTCIRSCVILAEAAFLACEMPRGWQMAVEQTIRLVSFWEEEIPDLQGWRAIFRRILPELNG
ncbi:hypothetical protein jhhlp_005367 [Lomentospora prolificans]|uniref:Zn(2)-C6 fungal-type domain-containing protein n=1 Tax=Lomentospora prolificans TaxID=41688 RepID=A0A2N3N6T8_9PEZI|nr:hypothetical protein jhhlp_005367 [Lomentospora prolificans]